MPRHLHLLRSMATLVLAFVGISTDTARGAERGFPMVCRGGGAMAYDVWHFDEAAWVLIKFIASEQAANTLPPRPGECTWLDRGVRADEPPYLLAKFSNISIVPTLRAEGSLENLTFFNKAGDRMARERRQQAEELLNTVRQGQPFQVHASQGTFRVGHRKVLVVRRIGP